MNLRAILHATTYTLRYYVALVTGRPPRVP
jgi:hypothetical protein